MYFDMHVNSMHGKSMHGKSMHRTHACFILCMESYIKAGQACKIHAYRPAFMQLITESSDECLVDFFFLQHLFVLSYF